MRWKYWRVFSLSGRKKVLKNKYQQKPSKQSSASAAVRSNQFHTDTNSIIFQQFSKHIELVHFVIWISTRLFEVIRDTGTANPKRKVEKQHQIDIIIRKGNKVSCNLRWICVRSLLLRVFFPRIRIEVDAKCNVIMSGHQWRLFVYSTGQDLESNELKRKTHKMFQLRTNGWRRGDFEVFSYWNSNRLRRAIKSKQNSQQKREREKSGERSAQSPCQEVTVIVCDKW